jgi:hypothetical protein
LDNAGNNSAAKMAMTAITTSNSMSVKPGHRAPFRRGDSPAGHWAFMVWIGAGKPLQAPSHYLQPFSGHVKATLAKSSVYPMPVGGAPTVKLSRHGA